MMPEAMWSVDDHFMTNINGLFASGDTKRGASLIVWAIAEGRKAAQGIHHYLQAGQFPSGSLIRLFLKRGVQPPSFSFSNFPKIQQTLLTDLEFLGVSCAACLMDFLNKPHFNVGKFCLWGRIRYSHF